MMSAIFEVGPISVDFSVETSSILSASNCTLAVSAGNDLSDFTDLEIKSANSFVRKYRDPIVTATTSKSGKTMMTWTRGYR